MSIRFKHLLLLLLLTSPLLAAKQESPLLTQLGAEFQGKEFTTKVPLGSSTRHLYALYGAQEVETHLIDTELQPNGRIQYRVRGILRAGGFYVPLSQVDSALPVGRRVQITKIEMMDDRIEFWLNGSEQRRPAGAYAKIKLVLGKGFEASYDRDAVIAVISKVLFIERYERLQALRSEYPELKVKLATAQGRFKTAQGNAPSQLQGARELQNALQALVKNRTDYDSLTQTLNDPEKDQYTREAADLEKTIAALDQETKKQRSEEIRKALTAEAEEAGQIKAQLQRKPGSFPEWEQQMTSLGRWEQTLNRQQSLHRELEGMGEPVAAADVAVLQQGFEEIQTLRGALEGQRQALQLADLDNQYQLMDRARRQLTDAYTRAFGTARQRPEGEKLFLHLHEMRQNREAAQKLGSDQALGQGASLAKDMERLQRQIGPVQTR
jgi:hypothetical protein